VALSISALQEKLDSQIKEAQKEVDGLGKKIQSLELTQKNSKEHINRMLGSGVGAS
jgi:flagellar biosynthesis chaperone FliJ